MCDVHFNFEEDRTKKLQSLSRAIGTSDGQTNTQVTLYLSNAMNCIVQTIINIMIRKKRSSELGDSQMPCVSNMTTMFAHAQ